MESDLFDGHCQIGIITLAVMVKRQRENVCTEFITLYLLPDEMYDRHKLFRIPAFENPVSCDGVCQVVRKKEVGESYLYTV